MTEPEPIYEFVPGQGWVIITPGMWCVVFKTSNCGWANTAHKGEKLTYKKAKESYENSLKRYAGMLGWEFKLIPYDDKY